MRHCERPRIVIPDIVLAAYDVAHSSEALNDDGLASAR